MSVEESCGSSVVGFDGYAQIGRTILRVRWLESPHAVVDFAETIPAQSVAVDRIVSEGLVHENLRPEYVPLCEACREE